MMTVRRRSRVWTQQPGFPAPPARDMLSAATLAASTFKLYGGAQVLPYLRGMAVACDGSAKYATRPIVLNRAPPLFLACHFRRQATPAGGSVLYSVSSSASYGAFCGIRASSTLSGLTVFYRTTDGGWYFEIGTTDPITTQGEDYSVVAVIPSLNSADAYLYVNGVKYNAQITAATVEASNLAFVNETLGAVKRDSVQLHYPGIVYEAGFGRKISEARAREISLNPREMFAPRKVRRILSSAGGGIVNAAASGGGTATGSASLAAQVALAGIGVSVAGGAATGAIAVPLSAAGLSVAGGAANGTATINISAAGLAQSAGQASLAASVLLAGAGAALAAGNAALAAQLNALAAGASQAGGSANLSGGATGSLSATGGDVASGAAVLSVTVGLQAAGGDVASGSANGTVNSPGSVSAAGGSVSGGAAVASVTASITAAGFVHAMGAGQLTISVNLAAFGAALSSGLAMISQPGTGLETDSKFIIHAAARNYVIKAAARNYTINRRSS